VALTTLTDRQRVILDLFSEGLVTKQVARHMHVSTETIKWHLTGIRRRLGATNTTHAVAIYLRDRKAHPHENPKGGPAPPFHHAAARDTNQEDTPA
jgi:DNA-binding CsgD family transcriptional regulator